MIGQKRLLNTISNMSLQTAPHTILLTGEDGADMNGVCDYIANTLSVMSIDITDNLSFEYISSILMSSTVTLYTINIDKISNNEQNVILKLIEEPTPYTYIVLYGVSDNLLLDTVKSRCYQLRMDKYTADELHPLILHDEDYVLSICSTPGQVQIANNTDLDELKKLCTNIITRIKEANYANSLKITDKINFNDEYSKFDFILFIHALEYEALMLGEFRYWEQFTELEKCIYNMNDKKHMLDYILTLMWCG